MDDDAFENLKDAFRAAPSSQLGRVIIEEYIRREELDAAGLLYRTSIDEHPDLQNDAWDEQFLEQEPEDLRAKLRVVEKDESVINMDTFRAKSSTFDDVVGLDKIKKQIHRKIILPFQKPSLFDRFRKKAGGGILLFGPPGCGKTLLARATAGECGAAFFNVALSDVLDAFIGGSEENLSAIFAKARTEAPAVIFFDEIEALAAKRAQDRNSSMNNVVSQMLTELDGFEQNNEKLLILASTNVPWAMDPAFLRPGRFDRMLFVPPPDKIARAAILKYHMRERPAEEKIKYDLLAEKTSGYSGADLEHLVESAADEAIDEAIATNEDTVIRFEHFKDALVDTRSTTVEWLSTARNYARYANDGGRYNDVLDFLKKHGK